MTSEAPLSCPDKTLYNAVYRPQEHQKLVIALDRCQVTFGLPPLQKDSEDITYLTIPSTPYIFNMDSLTFITQKPNYEHSFTLNNQVIFLCHGKRGNENPLDWELADGQNPLELIRMINNMDNGYPKIDAIVACRSIAPDVDRKFYRHPMGWPSVPNVIFQKVGTLDFSAQLDDNHITGWVTSTNSDFYRANKKGRLINLRKTYS